jgi:hypothetical protein
LIKYTTITIYAFLILFLYCFTYFIDVYALVDDLRDYISQKNNDIYQPQVDIILKPLEHTISQPVNISAKVFDKYGDFKNISILYSIDNDYSWKTERMNLTNGLPTNGTFFGTIPAQKENATVEYKIKYEDTLNYSSYSQFGQYHVVNHKIIHEISETRPDFPVKVSAYILDKENDIKNVTLFYSINENHNNISAVEMMQIGDRLLEAENTIF